MLPFLWEGVNIAAEVDLAAVYSISCINILEIDCFEKFATEWKSQARELVKLPYNKRLKQRSQTDMRIVKSEDWGIAADEGRVRRRT